MTPFSILPLDSIRQLYLIIYLFSSHVNYISFSIFPPVPIAWHNNTSYLNACAQSTFIVVFHLMFTTIPQAGAISRLDMREQRLSESIPSG